MFPMRITSFLLLSLLMCAACQNKDTHALEGLLVEVNGQLLYEEELQSAMPAGLSVDDSLLFAESYIQKWAEDALLYDVAEDNIRNSEEIERLVADYRKSLIVHTYRQELINQRLSPEVNEAEIANFYTNNQGLFVVKRPLIKGLYIKVPLNAPQLNDLRKWYQSETYSAVENLEKYSLVHAVSYDYFYERWTPVVDVLGKIPLKEENPELYIRNRKQVELQDTAFHYFLNVIDYLDKGDREPYEFAREEAKEMLVNTKKIDFMRKVKAELYEDALKKNKIKFNYK